jgi:S1/P1 Nuclease
MKSHRLLISIVFFVNFILIFNVAAFGWDDLGHMTVAYVAYQKLDPATRTHVDKLIKMNPDYAIWLTRIPKGTSAKDRGMMLFMIAATWPDQIKGKPGYINDKCDPADPVSAQNVGYCDENQHRCWHYKDTYFSTDGTGLPSEVVPNAETQIDTFRAALASDKSERLKSYDMVWLLHLVGDVHQPLHATARVSQADPHGDNGGNKVKICTPKCGDDLHSYWDQLAGTSKTPASAVTLGRTLPAADTAHAKDLITANWIGESFELAKQTVYVAPIEAGDGPFTMTAKYRKAGKAAAKRQLALAGARLANVLNGELK